MAGVNRELLLLLKNPEFNSNEVFSREGRRPRRLGRFFRKNQKQSRSHRLDLNSAQANKHCLRNRYSVSLFDVSKAAGVSISTASRVICGKAAGNRIRQSTQNRVLAVARELGYQPNLSTRDIVFGKPFRGEQSQRSVAVNQTQMIGIAAKRQKIDVLLSPVTSADTLIVIPSLILVLDAAGYGLVIQTVPADPVATAGLHRRTGRASGRRPGPGLHAGNYSGTGLGSGNRIDAGLTRKLK